MLSIFRNMLESHGGEPEQALSVIHDTLRVRDDWFEKIDSTVASPMQME